MAKYRVLIAYAHGIKDGFTQSIAEEIAAVLREDGFDTELRPAAEVVSVGPYDAVVLGGALRANRWHRDARRFARRHAAQLRSRPVWLFSSGPAGTAASEPGAAPVRGASRAMNRAGARGHITFGSRPVRHLRGLLDRSAADRDVGREADRDVDRGRGWPGDGRAPAADHQDMSRVRDWAHHIANEVNGP
ncbi:flavodoxin domain-containing protein [Streptomyces sp. NPDC053542]|uniref:flavodoxin domain-containing protein n=1 Tax=Streptomyces sp. NPDC053542 TaxID=3365710 RepID=UPI0037CD66D0